MPKRRSSTKDNNKNKRRARKTVESEDEDDISTPTLQEVRRLPRMDRLVISTEDGSETETIEADDWCASYMSFCMLSCAHIYIHESVFVAHHAMQLGPQLDGNVYWKMKIIFIHQEKGDIWVVGHWFYLPSDLKDLCLRRQCVLSFHCFSYIIYSFQIGRDKDLIPLMGDAELVLSDHIGVIDASCIEGISLAQSILAGDIDCRNR